MSSREWRLLAVTIALAAVCGSGCREAGSASVDNAAAEAPDRLSILSWTDYLVPTLLEKFETTHNVQIDVTEAGNSGQFIQILAAEPGQFDVVIADDRTLKTLIDLQLLARLDREQIPGLSHISENFRGQYCDPGNDYSVPYLWGTTVIAYRSGTVPGDRVSWKLLWDPVYRGRVALLDEPEDLFFIALQAEGIDPAKATESEIAEARDRLIGSFVEQGGRMRDYVTALDQLQAGDFDLAITYTGDAALRSMQDPSIRFAIPEEGAPLILDSFAISRDASAPRMAHQFIDYMVSPEAAAESANSLASPSPNAAARPFIDPKLLRHPGLYPEARLLEKCRYIRFSDTVQSLVRDGVRQVIETVRAKGIDPFGDSLGRTTRSAVPE